MFFEILIMPLVAAARFIFKYIHSFTHDYGISLVLLSVVSSAVMLVFMQTARRFSEREIKIQQIITPQIARIKKESKGHERHRRISELYKRYSYHPIMGLRSAVPVLIQLPFLFAAYVMLSKYEALNGISFLFIDDLSSPDRLLAGINVLPFIMTLVNVLTALISENFGSREKIQAGIIASFFLIILYNASSALLVFWTMNNFILLTRTIYKQSIFSQKHSVNTSIVRDKLVSSLKNNAFYPVLLAVYPAVFLVSNNPDQATLVDAIYPLLISFSFSVIIFYSMIKIFKDVSDAALYAFFITVFIFYYGFYHLVLNKIIASYTVSKIFDSHVPSLVSWITIFLLLLLYNIRFKKRNNSARIIFVLNIFSVVVITLSLLTIITHTLHNKTGLNTNKSLVKSGLLTKGGSDLPDIYYIILDGYTRNDVLQKIFSYDNSQFTETLKSKGFYIAEKSTSNYNNTNLCLSSALNMDYIQNLPIGQDDSTNHKKELYYITRNNDMAKYLRQYGYKFIHFQTGWGSTAVNQYADIDYSSGLFSEFSIMWVRTSVLSPFIHLVGITGNARNRVLKNFKILAEIKKINGPKFIFAHLVVPHPPYLFGPEGEDVSTSRVEFDGYLWKDKDSYIQQLRFVNKKVLELVNNLTGDKSYKPYIIIQGDHGTASGFDYVKTDAWDKPGYDQLFERMSILNAYYFPDKKYDMLYSHITPVNSFRLLLNTQFTAGHKILEDKNYWSTYLKSFKFRDITEQLRK